MVNNLIAICIGILFAIVAFISKNQIAKKIGIGIVIAAIIYIAMWSIGMYLEKRKAKKEAKNEEHPS